SYLRRYQLLALLGLAVEDDDAGTAQRAQSPAGATRGTSGSPPATPDQREEIRRLFDALGIDSGERANVGAQIVGHADRLSIIEAAKLIRTLSDRLDESTRS